MDQLREENFTKDGEVKVLRSEKERLLRELRKREEQLQKTHSKFTSEKRDIETKLSRENDSLTAKLQFQDQEIASLREKCLLLEQKSKMSLGAPRPVPISKPIKTSSKASTSPTTAFLSTESFMPQIDSAEVTPIHVKSKRTNRERSVSISDKRTTDTKPKKSRVSHSPTATPSDSLSGKKGSKSTNKPPEPTGVDPSLVLKVPGEELDNAQLLMLLVRPDLLKPPVFESETTEESSPPPVVVTSDKDSPSSEDDESSQYNPEDSPNSLSGLLSLLRVEPKSPGTFSTTNDASDSSMMSSPSASTPIAHKKGVVPKLATSSKSRLEQTTSSANYTPSYGHDMRLSTLLGSVDKKGLEKSIGDLLQSADKSAISRATGTSFCPSRLHSKMTENSNLKLLMRNIAATVVQYHTDQSAKAKGPANTSISDAGGDTTDSGASLGSQKSISKSISSSTNSLTSKTSSELLVPLKCDQRLVSKFLEMLETLVTYYRSVREQILFQSPSKLDLDSRPGSSMSMFASSSDNASPPSRITSRKRSFKPVRSDLAEVSRRLSLRDRSATPESPTKEATVSCVSQYSASASSVCVV